MLQRIGKKRILAFFICLIVFIAGAVAIILLTPAPSSNNLVEEIEDYAINKPNLRLSIAIISEEETNIYVFGHNGRNLKNNDKEYELGQLTQVFTGAITARGILNGDLRLDDKVGTVLPLPDSSYNPSVRELVTNTSAYSNLVPDKIGTAGNPYSNYSDFNVLMTMSSFEPESEPPYISSPSNFGVTVLGTYLADLYNSSTYAVLNDFIHLDLGLRNTFVSTSEQRVHPGYLWKMTDAYISSLGLSSTISDMASFVRMIQFGDIDYLDASITPLTELNEDKDIGFFWNISKDNSIISYSGETEHYASCIYMINKDSGGAVVVLSNYPNDKYGSVDEIAQMIIANGS